MHVAPDLAEPFEGVPGHLKGPVTDWLTQALLAGSGMFPARVALNLRFSIDTYAHEDAQAQLAEAASADPDFCLDAINAVLRLGPDDDDPLRPNEVDDLRDILQAGGSAWQVAADGRELERRVSQVVTATVAKAAERAGGDAEQHLNDAWHAVYGRNPDPRKAYSEAVHAAEAAAGPLVLASDPKATLGRMIGHLRNEAAHWQLGISQPGRADPEITPLLAMMQLLWEGETGRHATGKRARRETQPEAESAVHLAATLVHWFTSGAVRTANRQDESAERQAERGGKGEVP
jgi:hypothetical protein